jgi:hypothetical protein
MLHLFGKRLGQKGSTLYSGGFCARVGGEVPSIPMTERAMATAEVLVHRIRIGISDSSFLYFGVGSESISFTKRNKKLPAQKPRGYKGNPHNGDTVL